jgi:hypothetical protein
MAVNYRLPVKIKHIRTLYKNFRVGADINIFPVIQWLIESTTSFINKPVSFYIIQHTL